MRRPERSAFTLIELLTVLAIIAALVAILFPVFNRAREQARQASCLTNMHEVYLKVSLYKQDFDAYPPVLLGLPENADGTPWVPGSGEPVAAADVKNGFLYPAYVRNVASFRCPNNGDTDPRRIVNAVFPANPGFTGNATYQTHGIENADPAQAVPYYAINSYDITGAVSIDGSTVGSPYHVVYSRDWTNAEARGIDSRTDDANQLKYPNPPLDRTVLCWCNYHVQSGSDKCPILLASGSARAAFWKDVQSKTFNFAAP